MASDHLLSFRVQRIAESATLKMTQKARDMRAQGHDVISLSIGEPDFDTPEPIKVAAEKALAEGKTKYTPVSGISDLKKAIAKKFKEENNLDYAPNQIVVSNGAKQSIANACMALLNHGDESVIFAPYWVSYIEIANLCGATTIVIDTDIEDDFIVKPNQLKEALSDKTKIVLFSSPCNPTGSVYGATDLEPLVEVLKEYPDVVVISDEIYEYINFGDKHFSIGSYEEMKDRTVTVNGFSKGFAMTGWRLGYLGAPLWLAEAITKIQGQTTSGASSFGQWAAVTAIEGDKKELLPMQEAFRRRKDLVMDLLDDIAGIQINNPKGAFYLFPNIEGLFGKSYHGTTIENSDDFAEYLLEEAHVAVVAGSAFGDDRCFRLSYAASEEVLREAISRIAKAIEKLE